MTREERWQVSGSAPKIYDSELGVACSGVAPEPGAAPIEWHQASAEALPLADDGFDVVCCQLGLQFFVDRPVALHQMRRVLAPGGRLALMVWRSIDSPGFAALLAGLERHVGPGGGGGRALRGNLGKAAPPPSSRATPVRACHRGAATSV